MNEILDDFLAEKKMFSYEKYLYDGQVIKFHTNRILFPIGVKATINGQKPKDGLYRILDEGIRFEIIDGKVTHEFYIESYKQPNHQVIEIDGSRVYGIKKDSKVYIDNQPAPDGKYKRGRWFSIQVRNGVIV